MGNTKGESSEISEKELRTFKAISTKTWVSNKDIALITKLSRRQVNDYMLKFMKIGLIDQAEVWPEHLYRLSRFAAKRAPGYLERLRFTERVFKCRRKPNQK